MMKCYTGRMLETELFGEVKNAIEYPDKEMHMQYKTALNAVKGMQPYEDPSDPGPRFSNDLHATIAEMLEIEDYKQLRIFTCVHSVADYFHGVDAYVEFDLNDSKKKKTITITLDVTSNFEKYDLGHTKSDVLFYVSNEGLDPKDDRVEYKEKLEEIAIKVFNKIQIEKNY